MSWRRPLAGRVAERHGKRLAERQAPCSSSGSCPAPLPGVSVEPTPCRRHHWPQFRCQRLLLKTGEQAAAEVQNSTSRRCPDLGVYRQRLRPQGVGPICAPVAQRVPIRTFLCTADAPDDRQMPHESVAGVHDPDTLCIDWPSRARGRRGSVQKWTTPAPGLSARNGAA